MPRPNKRAPPQHAPRQPGCIGHESRQRPCLRIRSPEHAGGVLQGGWSRARRGVVIELAGREIIVRTIGEVVAQAWRSRDSRPRETRAHRYTGFSSNAAAGPVRCLPIARACGRGDALGCRHRPGRGHARRARPLRRRGHRGGRQLCADDWQPGGDFATSRARRGQWGSPISTTLTRLRHRLGKFGLLVIG